jgi:hypothetical protein
MAVITTGKTNFALPSISRSPCIEVLGNHQNCLANSTARLFSRLAHINCAAVPSVFEGKRYNAADTYELQPKINKIGSRELDRGRTCAVNSRTRCGTRREC